MRTVQGAAGLCFAIGASAAVLPRQNCCFQINASGGASGTVGQLDDGQNRIGGHYDPATYCIDGNGGITDANGRGCILTPPTTQFQCDVGAIPTNGFSIGADGQILYEESATFYACPATEVEFNIYTVPVEGQSKCVEVKLSSNGQCVGSGKGGDAAKPSGDKSVPTGGAPSQTQAHGKETKVPDHEQGKPPPKPEHEEEEETDDHEPEHEKESGRPDYDHGKKNGRPQYEHGKPNGKPHHPHGKPEHNAWHQL